MACTSAARTALAQTEPAQTKQAQTEREQRPGESEVTLDIDTGRGGASTWGCA